MTGEGCNWKLLSRVGRGREGKGYARIPRQPSTLQRYPRKERPFKIWCCLCRFILSYVNCILNRIEYQRPILNNFQQFFKHALAVVGHAPERVTTDGHTSYPRAVRKLLGTHVQHRSNKYCNKRLEQARQWITQRNNPIQSFGAGDP